MGYVFDWDANTPSIRLSGYCILLHPQLPASDASAFIDRLEIIY